MSRRAEETDDSVAARIEEVRKMTPPPKGRAARKSYISKDDFASVVGVKRSRIYAWTRRENPEYPDEKSRQRLAELSGGRYSPDAFQNPQSQRLGKGSLERRLEAVEEAVGRLELHIIGEGAAPK